MPNMNWDIIRYRIYLIENGELKETKKISSTKDYNHSTHELHHFIPKTMRKNKPEEYKKIEHLQKLILMRKDDHRSLPNWTNERCKEITGLEKHELLFDRRSQDV